MKFFAGSLLLFASSALAAEVRDLCGTGVSCMMRSERDGCEGRALSRVDRGSCADRRRASERKCCDTLFVQQYGGKDPHDFKRRMHA